MKLRTCRAGFLLTGGASFEVRTSADMLAYAGQLEPDTVKARAKGR